MLWNQNKPQIQDREWKMILNHDKKFAITKISVFWILYVSWAGKRNKGSKRKPN